MGRAVPTDGKVVGSGEEEGGKLFGSLKPTSQMSGEQLIPASKNQWGSKRVEGLWFSRGEDSVTKVWRQEQNVEGVCRNSKQGEGMKGGEHILRMGNGRAATECRAGAGSTHPKPSTISCFPRLL